MKIQHRWNHGWTPGGIDPEWAERVEREAERHTAASERAYAKAEARLRKAERQHQREATRQRPDKHRVQRLAAVVEARRQELLALERAMQQSPGGRQKHRPVPDQRRF